MPEKTIDIKIADSFLKMPATDDDFRKIHIILFRSPVSNQSSGKQKRKLKRFIQSLTKQVNYIIAGDVGIEIAWYTPENLRYEHSNFLDVDNVPKVIIDALSGPDGVLIDDCLVQHLSCTWIDSTDKERIEITIQYNEIQCFPKENLCFLHLGNNLYHIAATDSPKCILDNIISLFNLRQEYLAKSESQGNIAGLKTIQRFFTRNKLNSFKLMSYDDFPCVKDQASLSHEQGEYQQKATKLS